MNTPLILLAILNMFGLFMTAYQHGRPKKGKENFFLTFTAALIQWALIYWAWNC